MSLDSTATAETLYNKLTEVYEDKDIDFIAFLNTTLDNGFQSASTSLGNFDISPPAGSLNIPRKDIITPEEIAAEVSKYWAGAVGIGSPESCASVVSVTNTPDVVVTPIVTGLYALADKSQSGIASNPPFKEFVDIIYNAVKTITWTITESDTNCSATFTGTVS